MVITMNDKDQKIAYLEKIIALTPGNIYWKDKRGKYLGCNDNFANILKLPHREAIIGKSDHELMTQELADKVREADIVIMVADQEQILEEIGFDIQGKQAIYLSKKVPLHDEQNKVIGILGTSIDITKRKIAEESLLKNREELEKTNKVKSDFISSMAYIQNIITLLPGNIYWKDKTGHYLGCNETVANILKLNAPADIIGKNDIELLGKEYAEIVKKIDEEVVRNNQERIIEELGFDINGNPATYLSRKTPLHNETGEVIGLLGVSLDISERKNYEEALANAKEKAEAASQAKSDFLAVVSHELRIPLTGILGMAQLIEGENLYPDQHEQLADLIKSGEHLLMLITDLLDIAKLEAGKMELRCAPVNLRKLIEEMSTIISYQAKLKGLELLVEYPSDVPGVVIADARALRQIILNLTGNAIKFTEQGHVFIKLSVIERMDTQVMLALRVEDTGIGIPADKLAIVFDRFAQADNTRIRRHGGAGLGLTITKEYIELMDGRITVESQADKGAAFICEIPFELQSINLDENPWEIYTAEVRLLIVDDTLRGEILRKHIGSSLCEISDSKNTLNTIRAAQQAKQPFNIVIIDQQLNAIDALQLSQEIKSQPKLQQPLLLLMTAKISLTAQKTAKTAGFFDFLFKPVQPLETLITLTAIWERWQESKQIAHKKISPLTEAGIELKLCILLVEDEPIIQRVHQQMLAKMGCQVDIAENGEKALKMFTDCYYQLVLLDIGLPDMDGFTIARQMRNLEVTRGYTPIIGLTGYNSIEDQQNCYEAGMDAVAIKPIKPEELRQIVEKYVARFLAKLKK